jgi:hypothetical protein
MTKPETHPFPEKPIPEAQKRDDGAVRSFMPKTDFRGKPFGPNYPELNFKAGIMSPPVPASYIASLSDKKTAAATAD